MGGGGICASLVCRERTLPTWFKRRVCASLCLCPQGGISLGCALAPLTARAVWSDEDIFWGFMRLNLSLAVVGTLLLLAVVCRKSRDSLLLSRCSPCRCVDACLHCP